MPKETYFFKKHVDFRIFLKKALYYADQFEHFCLLNGNGYQNISGGSFPFSLALGSRSSIIVQNSKDFNAFQNRLESNERKWMGVFSYELKNLLESQLSSNNPDFIQAPLAAFFEPENILHFEQQKVTVEATLDPALLFDDINKVKIPDTTPFEGKLSQKISKEEYLTKVNALKKHIKSGDLYELNFCMEFFAKNKQVDPISSYIHLNESSATPFSGLLKFNDHYLISASPERFLKKEGKKLLSQPIKGTRKRSGDPSKDEQLANELLQDEKERAENVMIVDLVRNDLTPFARTGSIRVPELFGVYSFPQVHQLISSITAELKNESDGLKALLKAFPMGSMTGTPKLKAMQLSEEYEESKRGWYSGAMGYFNQGDYDFNVIIRSLIFNKKNGTISYQVGSAITYDASAKLEYEECQLKAKALRNAIYCFRN